MRILQNLLFPMLGMILASFPNGVFGKQIVTSVIDTVPVSFNGAIAASEAGDTIVFNIPGKDTCFLRSEVRFSNDLVIMGMNQSTNKKIVFKSKVATRAFIISNVRVVIQDVECTAADGGGFCVAGSESDVTLSNCVIRKCNAKTSAPISGGGGLCVIDGHVRLIGCKLADSRSATDGGAIYLNRGILEMTRDTIIGNEAESRGGGIFLNCGKVILDASLISGNTCGSGSGGGIFINNGYCSIAVSSVLNDTCIKTHDGLSMEAFSTSPSLSNNGGGIYNHGICCIHGSTIAGNTSKMVATGVRTNSNDLQYISYSSQGGGIYNDGYLYIINSTLFGNTAYLSAQSGSSVVGLNCSAEGGGIFNNIGKTTLHNVSIIGNKCLDYSMASTNAHCKKTFGSAGFDCAKGLNLLLNSLIIHNTVDWDEEHLDYTVTQGKAVHCLFGVGKATIAEACTSASDKKIIGIMPPVLSYNEGMVPLFMPASSAWELSGTGIRSGYFTHDTLVTACSTSLALPTAAYEFDGNWISIDSTMPLTSGATVTENKLDQRGGLRRNPPCIGSVEFMPSAGVSGKRFEPSPSFRISMKDNHIAVKGPPCPEASIAMYSLSGKRLGMLQLDLSEGRVRIPLGMYPRGIILCRILLPTGIVSQKTVQLND